MSKLVKLGSIVIGATAIIAATFMSSFADSDQPKFGVGQMATPQEIIYWDIDIRPDGKGLPQGQGTAAQGEEIFAGKCARCHGDFGEGLGNFPVLVGGDTKELKNGERPEKTVGSFWPYSPILFDYIRRAMPFGEAQSLTADETYALTAFILSANSIIDEDSVMNAKTLTAVKMPNAGGFYFDPKSDVKNTACMKDCTDGPAKISSYARILNVTPDGLAPGEQVNKE